MTVKPTTRRGVHIAVLPLLVLGAAVAPWAGTAKADEPATITHCTTEAIEHAVQEGGSYLLRCGGATIQAPKPAANPRDGLAHGFVVAEHKSLSFTAPRGEQPYFENAEDRGSRIFTVDVGASLTLTDVILLSRAVGPPGIAAGRAATGGERQAHGEEEQELEAAKQEVAAEGKSGANAPYQRIEGAAGFSGVEGRNGGTVHDQALAAPIAQGGAIFNDGEVTLDEDRFFGDQLSGGTGGDGAAGGRGGNGGNGSAGREQEDQLECDAGPFQSYDPYPPGAGGDGARGGEGGAGTAAGAGGDAQGGAVYNAGALTIQDSAFELDRVAGGDGGDGGNGGNGGQGGYGEWGYPGGEGGSGGGGGGGGDAGDGAAGLGGAIYNTGRLKVEGSSFGEDSATGGQSGDGASAGQAGDGGNAGTSGVKEECGFPGPSGSYAPPTDGADGGPGATGGNGANSGDGEGGAIYSTAPFTLTASTFTEDSIQAGLGASAVCEGEAPCAGDGSGGGKGGDGGDAATQGRQGSPGKNAAAHGLPGTIGVALAPDVFGQIESEAPVGGGNPKGGSGSGAGSNPVGSSSAPTGTPTNAGTKLYEIPPNPTPAAARATISRRGGVRTTRRNGIVTLATGEAIWCPPVGPACEAHVSVSVNVPAIGTDAALHAKTKTIVIGRREVVVAPGGTIAVTVPLSRRGAALLRGRRRLSVRVTVTVTLAGRASLRHARRITILQPAGA